MARGSWRNTPEYQFSEDNPDPKFRPKVDHLVVQLRKHSALVDHPEAVEHVLHDLMYWFLVREATEPARLWRLMNWAMLDWKMAIGLVPEKEEDDHVRRFAEAMMIGEQTEGEWVKEPTPPERQNLSNQSEQIRQAIVPVLQDTADQYIRVYEAGYKAGRDGEVKVRDEQASAEGRSDGDSPAVIRMTAHNTDVNFKDDNLKIGVAGVIAAHAIVMGDGVSWHCDCARSFESRTAWAVHVRKRIWRYMQNEFPAIGTPEEG